MGGGQSPPSLAYIFSPFFLFFYFLQSHKSTAALLNAQHQTSTQHTHTPLAIVSTLTHTTGNSQHSTPPTNTPTPTQQDYQQSLTLYYALQMFSFPWRTSARFSVVCKLLICVRFDYFLQQLIKLRVHHPLGFNFVIFQSITFGHLMLQ